MKPGWKTSEFWITAAATLVSLLVTGGVLTAAQGAEFGPALAAAITGIVAISTVIGLAKKYAELRSELKAPPEQIVLNRGGNEQVRDLNADYAKEVKQWFKDEEARRAAVVSESPAPHSNPLLGKYNISPPPEPPSRLPGLHSFLLALLGLGLVGSSLPAQQCLPWGCGPGQVHSQVQAPPAVVKATVLIKSSHGREIDAGSGVVVAVGQNAADEKERVALVLTNKHVCPQAGAISVLSPQTGTAYGARWLGVDDTADLCALLIRAPEQIAPLPLAAVEPSVGSQVYQVGFPRMRGPIQRGGRVRGYIGHVKHSGAPVWSVGFVVDQGDSGSPITTASGELAGLVWGGDASSTTAVGLQDVKRFTEVCIRRWLRISVNVQQPQQPPRPEPGPPPAVGVSEGNTAILDALALLRKDMEALAKRPGVPGPAGKDGKDGLPGPPGESPIAWKEQLDEQARRIAALEAQAAKAPAFFSIEPRTKR